MPQKLSPERRMGLHWGLTAFGETDPGAWVAQARALTPCTEIAREAAEKRRGKKLSHASIWGMLGRINEQADIGVIRFRRHW